MRLFRRKHTRRTDSARNRPEPRHWLYQMREGGALAGILIGVLFAALATGILLIGGRTSPRQLGERLDQPMVARVAFEMTNTRNPERMLRFEPGQEIADRGLIDERDLAVIRAEHEAFLASGGAGSLAVHILGLAGVVLLLTAGLGLYIWRYEPDIVRSPGGAIALAALILAALLAVRLTPLFAWQLEAHLFAAATASLLVVMVLGVVYSQRFALGAGWFLAVAIVLAARQPFAFMIVLLAGLETAALMLNPIRTRSKLVIVGATTAAVMAFATVAIGVVGGRWDTGIAASIGWQALASGSAALAAALIIQGLLPLIERVYGIATAMTLLEQSDVSRPLLRRLAAEAPGTFNHSLLLGSMAESAAEAIGANGLLARVGAYYHDIGKMNKPGYFVENQEGSFSRHAKLSPAMSLLIILGHVKDGLEMAREYGLPRVIWPFIGEHHGTTLVEYFYHAAAQKAAGQTAEPPPEGQFRYPGPRPRSRETAILMLCDSVEGATRALDDPTPGRIEDIVHQIARRKLHDGQLDECSLTLRELHLVEQSLVKSLWGFYHGRIAYPAAPDRDKERETRTA